MGERQQQQSSSIAVIGWITGSIISSVGLILINKAIMKTYSFSWVLTLTALHFFATAAAFELMAMMGMLERKKLPTAENWMVGAFCTGSVVFMNFSLEANSVGFYQMTKLLCIPCMVMIQTYVYSETFPGKIKATLAMVCLGVGIATVTDLELRPMGLVMGLLAVVFTSQFQIWANSKTRQHKMTSFQMNYSTAIPMAASASAAAALFDVVSPLSPPGKELLLEHEFQSPEVIMIVLSCLFAVMVNTCSQGLIASTSAVTYQVVGHAKTCLVLIGGFLLFPASATAASPQQTLKNLSGVAIAMAGVILYSHLKLMEKSPGQPDACDRCFPRAVLDFLEEKKPETPMIGSTEALPLTEKPVGGSVRPVGN